MEMIDCPIHNGQSSEDVQATLEIEMGNLPDSQAGAARHKCAYCAYVAGLRQGRKDTQREIAEKLNAFFSDLIG